jgi:hypothetical protein
MVGRNRDPVAGVFVTAVARQQHPAIQDFAADMIG